MRKWGGGIGSGEVGDMSEGEGSSPENLVIGVGFLNFKKRLKKKGRESFAGSLISFRI